MANGDPMCPRCGKYLANSYDYNGNHVCDADTWRMKAYDSHYTSFKIWSSTDRILEEFINMPVQQALLKFGEMNDGEVRLFKAMQLYLKNKMSE
jgi:hypothetical protein